MSELRRQCALQWLGAPPVRKGWAAMFAIRAPSHVEVVSVAMSVSS